MWFSAIVYADEWARKDETVYAVSVIDWFSRRANSVFVYVRSYSRSFLESLEWSQYYAGGWQGHTGGECILFSH